MHIRVALATLLLAISPAWAVNKCTDAAGKVSYQDEKCPAGKSEELKITGNATQADEGAYGGYGRASSSGSSAASSHGGSASGGSPMGGSGAVHTGPRGGRYTIGSTGRKNYIPRNKR